MPLYNIVASKACEKNIMICGCYTQIALNNFTTEPLTVPKMHGTEDALLWASLVIIGSDDCRW